MMFTKRESLGSDILREIVARRHYETVESAKCKISEQELNKKRGFKPKNKKLARGK